MKKSIKKFEVKGINNASAVKGGAFGRGTKHTVPTSNSKAELL